MNRVVEYISVRKRKIKNKKIKKEKTKLDEIMKRKGTGKEKAK